MLDIWFARAIKQRQIKAKRVVKSPRLHIKHTTSHDKTIPTRTFLSWQSLQIGFAIQRLRPTLHPWVQQSQCLHTTIG